LAIKKKHLGAQKKGGMAGGKLGLNTTPIFNPFWWFKKKSCGFFFIKKIPNPRGCPKTIIFYPPGGLSLFRGEKRLGEGEIITSILGVSQKML
jgi:hypothetical protein